MEPVRVFIVEDDPMVATINKRFTEKIPPFEVIGVGSTEKEAITQILATQPDLVLLDIFLTHGNGLNVLKEIRSHNLPTDFILVTAAKDTPTIHETLRYGAVDYLIKPFDMERLNKALQNYLKLRKALSHHVAWDQKELDELTSSYESHTPSSSTSLPKGVHRFTLDQIEQFLSQQTIPLSSQEIASQLTMSKITIWRYLEYLVEEGKVVVELEYKGLGRPTKQYKINR
jgi:two-component system, CitB family, response regulator DctR